MSKIAVISDIHANYLALKSVHHDMYQQEVDTVWFLGDLLDRGPFPVQTYNGLKNIMEQFSETVWLVGNHDLAVAGDFEYQKGMKTWFTEVQRHHNSILSDKMDELKSKKSMAVVTIGRKRGPIQVALSHGFPEPSGNFLESYVEDHAPGDSGGFAHTLEQWKSHEDKEFQAVGASKIFISGHSHVFVCWYWDGNTWKMPDEKFGVSLSGDLVWEQRKEDKDKPGLVTSIKIRDSQLSGNSLWVLNPGSVGFPRFQSLETRVGMARADYLIIDTNEDNDLPITLDFRSVEYNAAGLRQEYAKWSYPSEAANQLKNVYDV